MKGHVIPVVEIPLTKKDRPVSRRTRIARKVEVEITSSKQVTGDGLGKLDLSIGGKKKKRVPAFEMVVLGSGGGPLETDCSGYLVKPYCNTWEDGILALEGGSGLGALATLFEYRDPASMFPGIEFPSTHNTPVLRAAYVFSYLACYLISHAHLDHCLSLILLSGSVPPRAKSLSLSTNSRKSTSIPCTSTGSSLPRPPVYGTRQTLERLSLAYHGELWPELGAWAAEREGDDVSSNGNGNKDGGKTRHGKRKREGLVEDGLASGGGTGVIFSPLVASKVHRPLHPTLPITTLKFHVAHGCTTKGLYESSAMFIRYDPSSLSNSQDKRAERLESTKRIKRDEEEDDVADDREFLFFGDVESGWRKDGEEDWGRDHGEVASALNRAIWEEAAKSWDEGRLSGVFIECSYDTSRPANLMFGHISPPGLYHELQTLASLVKTSQTRPLDGLRIYITHIKDALVPHPSGRGSREIIMSELQELETGPDGGLGVEFIEVKKGDRFLI